MPKKRLLSQSNIIALAQKLGREISSQNLSRTKKAYGIPRGGVPALYIVANYCPDLTIVSEPEEADFFIDDIIDSGTTANRYKAKYGKPTFALINDSNREKGVWYTFPWEGIEINSQEDIPLRFLQAIGEDATRDGLKDTPARIVKSWKELYSGYGKTAKEALSTQFINEANYDEMVVLSDIEFYSTCEHHAQPFFGSVDIAYLPQGKVVGISKLARLVEVFARRLQIQEKFTEQIATAIMEELDPLGCGVVVRAKHFCMVARGIQKQNSVMTTSALKGKFLDDPRVREEFLSLAGK